MKAPFPWFGGKRRALERIWFSPHCLTAETQGTLFGGEAA